MKNNTSILPDELFNEGLNAHEVPFDPIAWEHMRILLEEDDQKPIFIVPSKSNNNNNKTLLIITIMSTLSIFSLATWMLLGTNKDFANTNTRQHIDKTAAVTQNNSSRGQSKNKNISNQSAINQLDINKSNNIVISNNKSQVFMQDFKSVMGDNQARQGFKTTFETNATNAILSPDPIKDSVSYVTNNGKTYRILIRKVWVPEEYEYVTKPREKTIQDFWIGIHFTTQKPLNSDTMSAGFNLQFMSGNRLKNSNWGLYGGFDWGMQFYGKSKKSNVVLNNSTLDSGYTRLRTHSMDFLGRAHLEYAKYALVPYINIMAGPRIYSTGQVVASYLPLKESESSTSHNAHTSVSMLYGFGFGARLRLSSYVSLDARYEFIKGTPVNLVDLNQSTFNGLNYNLKINKVNPVMEQFKIGIIFDLSSNDYEKKLVKEAYYKEYMYDSLTVDANDTNKIIMPCDCPCNTVKRYSPEQHSTIYENKDADTNNGSDNNNNNNNRNNRNNPTPTPAPKKSFPGIKPPVKPAEKL